MNLRVPPSFNSSFRFAFFGIAFILLIGGNSNVFAQETFEEYQQRLQREAQAFNQEFAKGVVQSQQEYDAFKKQWEEEFDAFKSEQEQQWGDFLERDQKLWVEYKETGKIRSSVDFEKGKGRVEILANSPEEVRIAKKKIAKQLLETFTKPPTEKGFPPKSKKLENKAATSTPALKGQIEAKNVSLEKKAEQLAEKNVATRSVKGKDGVKRTVVYVDFALAPNHLKTRAQAVEKEVYKYSKKFQLDPSLIFAIIHTESYYNPTAKSHANAHGLMQLVPTSGGRDAYRKAYRKDGVPTPEFLYNPDNNVHLGTTYITILQNAYFKGVESEVTRDYLAICAYNTGAGNVARAYTGKTSPRGALSKINGLSEQENFNLLVKNLPYEETRNYLKKVSKMRKMYQQWMKNPDAPLE